MTHFSYTYGGNTLPDSAQFYKKREICICWTSNNLAFNCLGFLVKTHRKSNALSIFCKAPISINALSFYKGAVLLPRQTGFPSWGPCAPRRAQVPLRRRASCEQTITITSSAHRTQQCYQTDLLFPSAHGRLILFSIAGRGQARGEMLGVIQMAVFAD